MKSCDYGFRVPGSWFRVREALVPSKFRSAVPSSCCLLESFFKGFRHKAVTIASAREELLECALEGCGEADHASRVKREEQRA